MFCYGRHQIKKNVFYWFDENHMTKEYLPPKISTEPDCTVFFFSFSWAFMEVQLKILENHGITKGQLAFFCNCLAYLMYFNNRTPHRTNWLAHLYLKLQWNPQGSTEILMCQRLLMLIK